MNNDNYQGGRNYNDGYNQNNHGREGFDRNRGNNNRSGNSFDGKFRNLVRLETMDHHLVYLQIVLQIEEDMVTLPNWMVTFFSYTHNVLVHVFDREVQQDSMFYNCSMENCNHICTTSNSRCMVSGSNYSYGTVIEDVATEHFGQTHKHGYFDYMRFGVRSI